MTTEGTPETTTKSPTLRERGLIALGEVARPHGLAGELRLKVYNLDSEILRKRPTVKLVLPDGSEQDLKITALREAEKAVLVRFAGVADRTGAEALQGATVAVPRASLPPAEDGEFYAWDIEGASAVLTSGEVVGRVLQLASYPTCDVLVIERAEQRAGQGPESKGKGHLEVPMTEAYVKRVDAERGVVELVTVEGLE